MKIRAAVLEEFGKPLEVQELDLEGPNAGEVLVKVEACGVCHTDLYTASGADPSGYVPTVLGHEGAGVVDRSARGLHLDGAGLPAGDAIVRPGVVGEALEAGAEDVREDDGSFEVISAPEDFDAVKDALEGAAIPFSDAEVTMLPQNMSPLEGKEAERMLKLMDAMDDCDDVQKVYTNADIPDDMVDAM